VIDDLRILNPFRWWEASSDQ